MNIVATTQVTFRIEEGLKKQAEQIFTEMGINMTSAINAFIRASVREGRLPFALVSDDYATKMKIIEKLNESVAIAENTDARRYTHEEIFRPLREKYGYEV